MPIGKDSVKRAVTAKKTKKNSTSVNESVLIDVAIADISYKSSKACPVLVESVKKNGVLLPIVAVKDGETLKLVDGAKRLNALKETGATTVKAVLVDGDVKKIKAELKKFAPSAACEENPVDLREQKFEAVKRLGESEMPVYLL